MGGNVAMLYAGVRPERIRKLVNLEGFGMPATRASQAPGRFAKWMDELKSLHRGEMALKPYNDVDGVARRLMRTNPRLTQDKADWLARHWAAPDAAWPVEHPGRRGPQDHQRPALPGRRSAGDLPLHQRAHAGRRGLGRFPGQMVAGQIHPGASTTSACKSVPQLRTAVVQDAGHMLHHDQPEQLAS